MKSVLFCFLLATQALAHQGHDHRDQPQNIEEFLELAHHELEVEGAHAQDFRSRLRAFLKALNPKEMILRGTEFYNIYSTDQKYSEHAKNVPFLLLTTEFLELGTGPATTFLVNTYDWPTWFDASLQSVGYFISTPFIVNATWLGPLAFLAEPYCLAMIASYAASKPVRNGVTQVRVGLTRGSNALCNKTGLARLAERYYPIVDTFKSLADLGWSIQVNTESLPEVLSYYISEDAWAQITVADKEGLYISSFQVAGLNLSEVKRLISPFNWSTRQLLLRSFKAGEPTSLKPGAVRIKETRSFCLKTLGARRAP